MKKQLLVLAVLFLTFAACKKDQATEPQSYITVTGVQSSLKPGSTTLMTDVFYVKTNAEFLNGEILTKNFQSTTSGEMTDGTYKFQVTRACSATPVEYSVLFSDGISRLVYDFKF